jgi:AmmeMemoRadiSam system protein B
VPIVAGDAPPEQVAQVIDALWGGQETLIVVSSDLSHYHDYTTAQRLDQETTELIEQQQYEKLAYDSACGKVPVAGLLKVVRDKALSIKAVDVRNSGDTAGDKSRVVGYGAYVVD